MNALHRQAEDVARALGRLEQAAKALDKCRAAAGYEAGYFCYDETVEHEEAIDAYAEALAAFVRAVPAVEVVRE